MEYLFMKTLVVVSEFGYIEILLKPTFYALKLKLKINLKLNLLHAMAKAHSMQ